MSSISKRDYKGKKELKAQKKHNRDNELKDEQGWKSKHKIHKSMKAYSRKDRRKGLDEF